MSIQCTVILIRRRFYQDPDDRWQSPSPGDRKAGSASQMVANGPSTALPDNTQASQNT
ncbi:MAG: hypothetical protein GY904_06690 [Planctomycetaceae bacterium]|nr:hypothetical protein [Planctomycetaceae bacterium]